MAQGWAVGGRGASEAARHAEYQRVRHVCGALPVRVPRRLLREPAPPACVLVPWKCPFPARFPQLWVPQSC